MDESGEKMKLLLTQKNCGKRKKKEVYVASWKTSKPFPMDKSGGKEMKLQILLLSLKDLLSEYGDRGEVGRTILNAYHTNLLQNVVETALTNFDQEAETSKPLPMDESGEKEMKLVLRRDLCKTSKPPKKRDLRSGYAVPGCGEVGRIIVSGYDKELPQDVVEKALRNHFSQCGRITDVYVPRFGNGNGSYVYFIGEGAVEKALQLNGTDVGGWTVNIQPFPFLPYAKRILWLTVEGFDTSRSKIDIERALIDLFSSCGEVYNVRVYNSDAELFVNGEDVEEKVPKLNGSSFMRHHKLVFHHVCYPEIRTIHHRPYGRLLDCPAHNCGKGMLENNLMI